MENLLRKFRLLFPLIILLSSLTGCSDEAISTASLPNPAELSTTQATPVIPAEQTQPGPVTQELPTQTAPIEITPEPTATLLPMTTPTPAPPPLHPIPGIELYNLDIPSLQLVEKANAYWVRRNALPWSVVEPEENLRNWDAVGGLEIELKNAAQQGLPVILILRSAPAWAQKRAGFACGPIAQEKLETFGRFVFDVVRRYSAPPYNVKYWEFWNEPDVELGLVEPDSVYGCWGDPDDPYYGGEVYAEMLKQVYPKIKTADPDSQALVGGLLLDCDPVNPPEGKTCQSSKFLEGILRAGGGNAFDGISFHAYDYYDDPYQFSNINWNSHWDSAGPVLVAKSRYIRSLLAAYQLTGKFLINTESGMLCGRTGMEPKCQTPDYELTKAIYITKANLIARVEGLLGNVWYSLEGWRGTWLVDQNKRPLPSYQALQFIGQLLRDASLIRQVTDFPGVTGYELQKNGRRILILWSTDLENHPLTFNQLPNTIYNIFGEPQIFEEILVGPQPVYLEWSSP